MKSSLIFVVAVLLASFANASGNSNNSSNTTNNSYDSHDANANSTAVAGAAAINSTSVRTDVDVTSVGVGIAAGGDARSSATQGQHQDQGQLQGQLQGQTASSDQSQSQSADNAGNSQSITFEGPDNNQKIRNTPTAIAPDVYPTAACVKGASVGFSGPGIGGSFGGGGIDGDCSLRETARLAAALGAKTFAYQLICAQESVKKAMKKDPTILCPVTEVDAAPLN